MDVNNLMEMAGQLRERLSAAQNEAKDLTVTTEAGGGMVKVVMNGQHQVTQLQLDESLLGGAVKAADLRLLEDLVRAAVNQAAIDVAEAMKGRMGGLAKDFGVDMSAFDLPGMPK
jgi:DNA-binding YbaB/EbfC family protein